ncbi:MAG TPA: asparaginase, partial [Blastocatellia bacterium]|nr:asparaginase [Blastocatellia bacterium]
ARLGDQNITTSTRSAIKPIQALPVITSGAADHFHLTPREIAVICASHDGETVHTETIAGILYRIGLDEGALRCGAHAPYSEAAARRLEQEGKAFNQLHNNCSGKHAGMLATAVHRGLPAENYTEPDHPVQRAIISTFARLAGIDEHLPTATDGCSAPTFGVPLIALATAFARLVSGEDPDTASASRRVIEAVIAHPEMVGGTKGRFDTDLLRAARGKLICKVGAEAVYAVGVLPSERFPRGLGIAFKVEDGSYRGLGPAVIETLARFDVLDESERSQLASYHRPALINRRNIEVGEVRPVFDIDLN